MTSESSGPCLARDVLAVASGCEPNVIEVSRKRVDIDVIWPLQCRFYYQSPFLALDVAPTLMRVWPQRDVVKIMNNSNQILSNHWPDLPYVVHKTFPQLNFSGLHLGA